MALVPVAMDIAVNVGVLLSDYNSSYCNVEEERWGQDNLESTSQYETCVIVMIFSKSISEFDLLKTAISCWAYMILGVTKDIIIHKDLVELVQLLTVVE